MPENYIHIIPAKDTHSTFSTYKITLFFVLGIFLGTGIFFSLFKPILAGSTGLKQIMGTLPSHRENSEIITASPEYTDESEIYSLESQKDTGQIIEFTNEPSPPKSPTPSPAVTISPTPTPSPIPTVAQKTEKVAVDELEVLFGKYAAEYEVDRGYLKKIAQCESELISNAASPSGLYVGLFQFNPDTWSSVRNQLGKDPNPDLRASAEDSIQAAAYLISRGQASHWPNCK
jgi:hypothetical protein